MLSRRDALRLMGASAATVMAGGLLTDTAVSLAQTAVPTATPVPPPPKPLGLFVFNVGALEVTVIRDAARELDLATVFATSNTNGEVTNFLKENNINSTKIPNTFNVILVKSGSTMALFDTGNGGAVGSLVVTLASIGVKPDMITHVVFSHQHGDHIGGALTSGALTFPKASYHYPEAEKAAVEKAPEGGGVTNNKNLFKAAEAAGQFQTFKPDAELLPGVMPFAAYGHTAGHTGFMLSSNGASLTVVADAMLNNVISTARPEWQPSFDADKLMAVETRKKLLSDAATKGTRILAYHFPFPGTGFIDKDGDTYRFIPSM
jgi:glyoxylase-like metal-dependent hydrolase (beta-lactamase superfamily II)